MARPQHLSVTILGPFSVHKGAPLDLTVQQRRLVAALALRHPEPVESEWLAAAVHGPGASRRTLHTSVWRARQLLGTEAIESVGDTYRLNPTTSVDLDAFTTAIRADAHDRSAATAAERERRVGAALAMWSGDLLEGVEFGVGVDPWRVDAERLRLDALEQRAALLAEIGHREESERALRAVLDVDPTREHSWRRLIQSVTISLGADDARAVALAAERALADVGLVASAGLAAAITAVTAVSGTVGISTSAAPSSPGFVGRTDELRVLRQALADVRSGRPRAVVVAGEAGIGKSALAAEAVAIAAADGVVVWTGRTDPYETSRYRPVLDVLRGLVASSDEAIQTMAHSGTVGALLAAPTDNDTGRDGVGRRLELFDAIGDLLAAATAGRPSMILIEDVHWADEGTTLLARHLLTTRPRLPVLIVATVRTGETTASGATEAVGALLRHPGLSWLTLDGLDVDEILALTQWRLDGLGSDEARRVARHVHASSRGNPLFAHRLLDHPHPIARDDEAAPPTALSHLVAAHVAVLDESVREVLAYAAAQGDVFDPALVAAALGVRDVVPMLDSAERAGVVNYTDGQWVISHPLVRQALDHRGSTVERARRHLATAQSIEAVPDATDRQLRLAHHYSAARALVGDDVAAAHAASAAAAAERSLDFGLAARLYAKAASFRSGLDAVWLRVHEADSMRSAGDVPGALAGVRRAINAIGPDADSARLAEIAVRAARVEQRDGVALAAHTRALVDAAVGSSRDPYVAAELLARWALDAAEPGQVAAMIGASTEGEDARQRAAESAYWMASPIDRPALADLLRNGHPVTPASRIRRDVALAAQQVETGTAWPEVAYEPNDGPPDVDDIYAGWLTQTWTATRRLAEGRFAEALTATRSAYRIGADLPQDTDAWRTAMATYYGVGIGVEVAMHTTFSGAHLELLPAQWSEQPQVWLAIHAECALGRGDVAEARRIVAIAVDDLFANGLRCPYIAYQLVSLARVAVLCGDGPRSERLYNALQSHIDEHTLVRSTLYQGAVRYWLGLAEALAGPSDNAVALLEQALEQHRHLGVTYFEALTLATLGGTLRRRGRATDAEFADAAIADALAMGTRMGSDRPALVLALTG